MLNLVTKLNTSLGPVLREELNTNFEKIEQHSGNVDTDVSKALLLANNANSISNDTKERLANVITGQEQPSEVVDARHSSIENKEYDTLTDRLNNIEKYQQTGIVNFTFDDSYRENRLTKSIFDEYGLICDFAVITDKVNNATNDYQGISWYLDAQNAGYGIMSHTRSHPDLNVSGLPENVPYKEIVTSKAILKNLGLTVSGFVSPSSVTYQSYETLVEENYDYAINHSAVNNINAPMDKSVDRYHLQRMSLANTDIEIIKQAIDKTIDQKLLLMFYDHRTGYDGSATEEKLRSILDYVNEKMSDHRLKVMKSVDAISEFYGVNQVETSPVTAKANELALPIARYLINTSTNMTAWNAITTGSPDFHFTQKDSYVILPFDSKQQTSPVEFFQVVDVSSHAGELQPHFLSISAPLNASNNIPEDLEVYAFARSYDADGNQLGDVDKKRFYVSGDKIVYNAIFSFPRNADNVQIGYMLSSNTTVSGNINIFQPSILEDQVGYTGDFKDVDTNMQVGFTPDISKPLSWSFASLPSFTTGIARRYFNYDPNNNYITCIIAGTYEFRTLAAYKITGNNPSTNPRILLEMRVNDDNASHTNALMRMQSTRAVGDIYNIDSSLKITLKAGDQVRFATDADMAGTPTMEAIANSFVVIRREV